MANGDDDVSSYLFSQNLTAQAPPLQTRGSAQAPDQPPPPPPPPEDHTAEFPRYQQPAPPPQLRQYSMPPPPQGQQFSDPLEALNIFKNPAIALAGLSSLLTRQPLVTALNAGAAAMKGFHQGQQDVFAQNKENFDENLKAAMEQNKVELTRYNAAWDQRKEMDWEKVAPKMYTEAARNGDSLMVQALNTHNWELVEKVLLGREQAQNAYNKAFEAQDARDRAQQEQIDRWTKDPGIIGRVEQIRKLQAPAPPQSSRNPQNQAIWQLLSTPDPQTGKVYDTRDYSARISASSQLSKPSTNNMGGKSVSVHAVSGHLQELDQLIDALEQAKITGDFVPANRVSVAIRRANSYPEITNYEIGADIASKELVKAIVPGGGGEGERQKMEQNLSVDHGPKALHAAANTLRGFLRVQYDALESWADTNNVSDQFQGVIGRNTKAILEGGGKPAAVKVSSPSEAQALAPGTRYVTPDGHEYTR
jgi:hypothetical protein